MTVRLSTGLCAALLKGGTTGGIQGGFNGCFVNVYQGAQPADADTGIPNLLLGTATLNDDGSSGLHFDDPVLNVISKAVAEVWRFHGLAQGIAGCFRIYMTGDTVTANSTTAVRADGSVGTSGADAIVSNTSIVVAASTTIDALAITMPKN
jgi:hypothetical protein